MLKITESIKHDRIVAKCYAELGDVTKEKGQYDESLCYHRKSLEIFERVADALSVADTHLNIAAVYKAKGELKQAMHEYEKGLTLYEDVVVDDAYKKSDNGTDLSLSSSSFSDRHLNRKLSKSDEALSQKKSIDFLDKDIRTSSSDLMSLSTSSSDVFVSSKKKSAPQLTTNISDSAVFLSESTDAELLQSFSSSDASEIQNINDNNMESELSTVELSFEAAVETRTDENSIRRRCRHCLAPIEPINENSSMLNTETPVNDTNLDENNNCDNSIKLDSKTQSNKTIWDYLANKQFIIVILIILIGIIISQSLHNNPKKSMVMKSTSTISSSKHSRIFRQDDLSEQLRKILPLRKDHIQSLPKNHRRVIATFINNFRNRTKMSVERFQKILQILDLKLVLIPR